MAVGKNKRRPKKGNKKKVIDPFARKEWYDIRAPSIFKHPYVGKTMVNQTQGKVLASDGLKGRVFQVSLADLNKDEDRAYRTISLVAEAIEGNQVLTGFHGMSLTSDKLKSLVRKWQTLIESVVEVKTTDNYVIRMFCIGFTKKRANQKKITCYAQSSQVRQIRKKMVDIMTREATTCDIRALFQKFIAESISKQVELECQGIYPLQNVFIRKAKILKRPAYDAYKMVNLHAEPLAAEDTGAAVSSGTATTVGATPAAQ